MSTAVSAPGKVLLSGGYLVLDREYTGLVFGLSARIHVVVEEIKTQEGVMLQEIVVKSPQFTNAEWIYGYRGVEQEGGILVTQLQGALSAPSSRNPFVETTLSYVLTYISSLTKSHTIAPTQITILADNDYYSRPSSAKSTTQSQFTNFNIPLSSAHKTGLGSSAALVTSLTAALLFHYLPTEHSSMTSSQGRTILHNLSQAAHCAAQGKIGSGFDIAAAVYGSCIYRRFSPALLSSIGEPGCSNFARNLIECITARWDTECRGEDVKIPNGMQLLMCDVDCGSATPGMVKNVLVWRETSPESSKELWDRLQAANDRLTIELRNGHEDQLRTAILEIREKIQEMGRESGVEIEPQSQTELLNVLSTLDGVIGGVVPGAGGYDAVVLLVKDEEENVGEIKRFLIEWSEKTNGTIRLLDVRGEMEGVRSEDLKLYRGWLNK